ncbi:PREDICTED: uncharacterized protein LOC109583283 [Amphimedon queenslandica]|uniref:Uncharacterized protein n=1 Tax=Amphimedon queenslandica TaxID=400682 RepID=A0A1X7UIC8_AMPQE|nr:PREDICTED: uncharacterized protein LOC109583283 [Amphimedon queenslandica]|eukprot:XP_019854112.1 PREDICTED: uncharacterized protein LOC109583283 [Amphimedon queenslandica]
MYRFLFLVCIGVALACVPPDCKNEDCGTCANACCILQFTFKASTDDVDKLMVDSLKNGGDDGRYTLVNNSDYRPYNMSVKFMLQTIHTTKVHHYNDTQDWLVSEGKEEGTTVVKAFSISNIYGAYCDAGQNYKNLVGFVKGLNVDFKQEAIAGCPPPKE